MDANEQVTTAAYDWDFLHALDLIQPEEESYNRYHVYKGGAVHLKDGTWEQLLPLCGQLDFQVGAPDALSILRDEGFLVETVFDKAGFRAAMTEHAGQLAKRELTFRDTLFAREKVSGNPRAELCYEKAMQACGFEGRPDYRVLTERFIDLAELIR